jgi:hypothetical protein
VNTYLAFCTSAVRVEDHQTDDVFYVYPDKMQRDQPLPETLDDAYGNGFLTISLWDSKFATWYLNIANGEYAGPLHEMQMILYKWAKDEGYQF